MKYACSVEYNGSNYHGWQQQLGYVSVQEQCQQALSQIADHPITIIAAGRTDSGVHATNQIFHFESTAQRQEHNWLQGANSILPSDIRLRWVVEVANSFHARFSALERGYRYIIWNSQSQPALLSKLVLPIGYQLSLSNMQRASQALIGSHDFSAFRAVGCQASHARRCVKSLLIQREGCCIYIDIVANGFLQNMVRIIVGCLLAIGGGEESETWLGYLLRVRDRALGAATISPDGLYLTYVRYDQSMLSVNQNPVLPNLHISPQIEPLPYMRSAVASY